MTAADYCRQHGWAEGDYYADGLDVLRITHVGERYILAVDKGGQEYPERWIFASAMRVANYACDPLPAGEQPESTL